MIANAEKFKQADKDFSEKHSAKQELETYVSTVEATLSSPDFSSKAKRGQKVGVSARSAIFADDALQSAVESQLAAALEKLEVEDSSPEDLRKGATSAPVGAHN
jgi:heat shock protein 1/8